MTTKTETKTPKIFISYSWSSDEHQAWVLNLATELRESGIDVILDKWDLREGHDAHAFMEKMVGDPDIDHVILVCDARYVAKANSRSGGVGTEAQIISPAIYDKVDQKKFVAVVREKNADGQAYVPIYYGSRIFIDLSADDLYASNFDQLLRWVYDKPVHVKPALGSMPSFLAAPVGPSLENAALHRRALDSIRNQKATSIGLLEEYLETCLSGLEKFRISGRGKTDFDEDVVSSIKSFMPHRNEIVEVIVALLRYERSEAGLHKLHRFFEGLLPYCDVPDGVNQYSEWDFDNFRFIAHELFLYSIGAALKSERFDVASTLLSEFYFIPATMRGPSKSVSFEIFREHVPSLEGRNARLKLRRLSVRADLLKERCVGTGIEFRQLAQGDFFLFVRSCVDALANTQSHSWSYQWWPETLVFSREYDGAFEIFARAESASYFSRLRGCLRVTDKAGLGAVLDALKAKKLKVPTWEFERVNSATLLGFDKLATRA